LRTACVHCVRRGFSLPHSADGPESIWVVIMREWSFARLVNPQQPAGTTGEQEKSQ
jgi:hypothetical protein